MYKAESVEITKPCELSEIPDGEYRGIYGGYIVTTTIGGDVYTIHMKDGIRTPCAPCKIFICGGDVTVELPKGE